MYLKRLELQGFKSFPDKIKLEFNKGITAVVGPNGSGKSNISDAIRWVLGEQSAKNLRGGKMEDIIFSGTQNRRGLGFAEVSLTIDNSDKKMKLDYTEITVSRRVYRSGDSEFLINGVSCRLKDIHEMFMDTGVGREGYSIIGQGRIQEILNSRSEDKRLLFEEATGIAKSKNRRNEANVKLEKERQNLIRVNDIIAELEFQIEPLKEQSEVAKKYMTLKERLKLLQVNIFLKESDRLTKELDVLTKNIDIVDEQILKCIDEKDHIVNVCKDLKKQLSENEESLKETNLKILDLKSNIEEKENEIRITKEKINFINSDISRLHNDISKKTCALQKFEEDKKIENAKVIKLEMHLHMKEKELKEKELEFGVLTSEMTDSEMKIEFINNEIIEKIKTLSDIKGNIERLKSVKEQLYEKDKYINVENNVVINQIKENETRLQDLNTNLNNLNEEYKEMKSYKNDFENIQSKKSEELKSKKDEHTNVCKVISELSSRNKVLTELEQSYEGYYKPVKSILKIKNSDKENLYGICGVIAELMSVPKELELCIEIALGSSLQNIVTKTELDAKKAIEYLKKTKEGRATFLPITTISNKKLNNKDEISKEVGVLGIASELIQFEDVYSGIFSNLLGRIIIVDNIDNGLKIFKKYKYSHKIVTLEGEYLNSGGAMTGGSINNKLGNILSRSREIKEITENLNKILKEETKLELEINNIYNEIDSITTKTNEINLKILNIEKDKISLEHIIEETKSQIHRFNEDKVKLKTEKTQLEEQSAKCNSSLHEYELQLISKENEILEIQNTLEQYQSKVVYSKDIKENKLKELTDIKIQFSEISQNIKNENDELNWISSEMQIVKLEIKNFEIEVEKKENEKLHKEQTIKNNEIEIQIEKSKRDQFIVSLNNTENTKKKLTIQLEKFIEDERKNFEMLSNLKNELTKLNFKKERLEEDSRNIYDYMWEEYSITLKVAKEYPVLENTVFELRADEKSIKTELQALGSVNVNSIEEYKTVTKRCEFLTNQRDDILEAEKQLLQIIDELTTLMEKQFSEQFQLISESFSKVFSEMFGGGSAFLQLKDSSKPLESPIDIIAKPPGKNLQNMSLMSGGELALTATSLLFGILRLKPSPFCILDEVEAALDDANVNRYANFLKNFCHETQFILITHRKGTMECADVLYGVTMQEHGVSKLVSAKLTEEKPSA